jgi:decaprenyl-phosphate phosphoribosyltransferase
MGLLFDILRSLRPRQWLKNLALYAALIFSGNLIYPDQFIIVSFAVIVFSIISSSIYLFNDIADIGNDRSHPYKKNRPIASGRIPVPLALFLAVCGAFLGLYLSLSFSFFFFMLCLSYLVLHLAYSYLLKDIAIIDVLIIATGFVIRVYAGAVIIGVHLSVWFLLCVISMSLFLAVGKRMAELTILTGTGQTTRKTLSTYPPSLLSDYLAIFASSAWLSWALFTFFEPLPIIPRLAFFVHFPLTFSGIEKWLMITIPVVIYGIMRYLKIIYEGGKAESPERVLLSDKPLLATFLLFGILVMGIIYGTRI